MKRSLIKKPLSSLVLDKPRGVLQLTRRVYLLPVFLIAVAALILAAPVRTVGETLPFDAAAIFLEENATDGDLGVHFFLDGEDWKRVSIHFPNGRRMVNLRVSGNAKQIGLTELFSESAEPSFEDLPREEFLELFPEGMYRFMGRTIEGDMLMGMARLTHTMPAAPAITFPEEDDEVDTAAPVVIEWEMVADPNPPASVIVGYEIIVEKDEEGEAPLVFRADLGPTKTSVTVPPEFFEPGKDYKTEVIAIETSGNRIITEVPFSTMD